MFYAERRCYITCQTANMDEDIHFFMLYISKQFNSFQ